MYKISITQVVVKYVFDLAYKSLIGLTLFRSVFFTLKYNSFFFQIEEDIANYAQYNIMKQEEKQATLRLNKGVRPHILNFQKRHVPVS